MGLSKRVANNRYPPPTDEVRDAIHTVTEHHYAGQNSSIRKEALENAMRTLTRLARNQHWVIYVS